MKPSLVFCWLTRKDRVISYRFLLPIPDLILNGHVQVQGAAYLPAYDLQNYSEAISSTPDTLGYRVSKAMHEGSNSL